MSCLHSEIPAHLQPMTRRHNRRDKGKVTNSCQFSQQIAEKFLYTSISERQRKAREYPCFSPQMIRRLFKFENYQSV